MLEALSGKEELNMQPYVNKQNAILEILVDTLSGCSLQTRRREVPSFTYQDK
jgi:hypothetical protein